MLLNERRVKDTILELINSECAPQELDVRWQANHVVVLESHVERLDRLLSARLVNDALRDHWVVVS